MNLVVIFGPPAVGKMTVGQELARLTGYKLLYNHMILDLVTELFAYGTPQFTRLVPEFRRLLVQEAAQSDLPGLIFTYVWSFNLERSQAFMADLRELVLGNGGQVFYAELYADIDERRRRNLSENRHKHKKKAKQDLPDERLFALEQEHLMSSDGDFPYTDQHIKIDNTHLWPEAVAAQIARSFGLIAPE